MIRLAPLPLLLAVAVAILLLVAAADDSHGFYSSRAHVKATICEVFGQRCGPALRVVSCETGGTFNPWARGRAGERGLFQIHPIHFGWLDEAKLWRPGYNALIAYRLSRGGRDWSAWSCRP